MITEIKHKRYRYQVRALGYRYLFFNREDAEKCKKHVLTAYDAMEQHVFDNYSKVLVSIKKSGKKLSCKGSVQQHLAQIENCIHMIVFSTFRDDRERWLRQAYHGMLELQDMLGIKYSKELERVIYSPIDIEYKSKWIVTER